MRRLLLSLLKVGISAALLYFALRNTDFGALTKRFDEHSALWLALAGGAILLQSVFAAVRFILLSDLCGAPLAIGTAIRFTMIGVFFNQTLPSSAGGDAVKLWLIGRRTGWRSATYAVLIDRAIGVIALALLILLSLPWSLSLIADPHARPALVLTDVIALGVGAAFLLCAVLPTRWFDVWAPTRHARACAAIAVRVLASPRRGPFIAFLSISIHMLNAVTAWGAARAIAAPVGLFELLMLMPPVALITLVPISIAGWGLRETVMGAAFAASGLIAAEGINVSLVYGAVNFLIGGIGGLVWILSAEKAEQGTKPIEMPAALAD